MLCGVWNDGDPEELWMNLAGAAARAQQVPGPHLPFPAPTAPIPGKSGAGAAARENGRRRMKKPIWM